MKIISMLALLAASFIQETFAQSFSKKWDMNIAGNAADVPVCFQQLSDSGYIILASSSSGIAFDKTDINRDSSGLTPDFWLIRLDKFGVKIWDKTYGGNGADIPGALLVLPNGFVLGGTSSSPVSGEKTDTLRGVADYWVLMVDTAGQVLWDKTIGGPLLDQLNALVITTDQKLMLSGWTLSGTGGDKVTPGFGDFDFWLVKLDLSGNFILENSLGGLLADNCYAAVSASNGGALLAGYSNSPVSFSKSSAPRGGFDFWVVRVDSLGRKLWDKTIGGTADDFAFSACAVPGVAKGYIIGGDSFSGSGAEKTETSRGADDFWVVRILDNGSIVWDKTIGGSDYDELNYLSFSAGGQLVLSGESYSNASFEKTENNLGAEQIWMVLMDTSGQVVLDKTFFTTGHDEYAQGIVTTDDCLAGITFTAADTGGYRTFYNQGAGDIWLCKLCLLTGLTNPPDHEREVIIYPNPAHREFTIFNAGTAPLYFRFTDSSGRLLIEGNCTDEKCRIQTAHLETGMYFISFQIGERQFVKKLMLY